MIGQRIAEKRKEQGWAQADLGRELSNVLGYEWSRQAVWNAEKGNRAFPIAEVVGIAYVLDTTVAELMRPSRGDEEIELAGATIDYLDLIEPERPEAPLGDVFREMEDLTAEVHQVVDDFQRQWLVSFHEPLEELKVKIDQARRLTRRGKK